MKNSIKTKILLFLFIAILALSPVCMANDVDCMVSDTNTEMSSDSSSEGTYVSEYVASDLYTFNEEVIIDTIVDGNAFILGNNITISGEIGGDLFAFGENVKIENTAYIHGNIFVYAENFEMNGICYDVYSISQNFNLNKDAIIVRDIKSISEKIHINGQIKRNAYITTNELIFPDNSTNLIAGNLDYHSNYEFAIKDGIVGGEITFTQEVSEQPTITDIFTSHVTNIIATLLYSLVVIVLTIWMAPKFKEKSALILQKRAPLSFGVGLLTSVVISVGSILLLFTTLGLSFGVSVAAITIFILALTISKTVFSMALGKLISKKFKKDNNVIFIGMSLLFVLAVSLIELVPYVGGFVSFAVTMIGFGIILLNLISRKNLEDTKTENKIEETNPVITK